MACFVICSLFPFPQPIGYARDGITEPDARGEDEEKQYPVPHYDYLLRLLEHLAQPRMPALLLVPLDNLRYLRPLAN